MPKLSRACVRGVAGLALAVGLWAVPAAHASTPLKQSIDTTYQTNGHVSSMVTVGNVTYLGGSFTALRPARTPPGDPDEVTRLHLAAIDNATGQVLAWNPSADGIVRALAVSPDGTTIYAGGDFGFVHGLKRPRLAALDASTGAVGSLTATITGSVYGVAATATKVYFGGGFLTVNGQPRLRLAALDTDATLDPTWTPAADATVRAIQLDPDGTAVYVGGLFKSINGKTSQSKIARLSPTTGAPMLWVSHPGYPVEAIAATATRVFVGGDGKGGNAAAYTTTGTRQWRVQTDGGVQAIANAAGVVYIGGHFDNVCVDATLPKVHPSLYTCPHGSIVRHKLYAVDAVTATLDPWAPNPNSITGVYALATPGPKLDVGGDFTLVGNPRVAQQGFAQFSP